MFATLALFLCSSVAVSEPATETVYLLAYFRTPEEALHYAYSKDGLTWHALNGNRPVMRAGIGNKSIRDPFIRRGPDGWFHLVSTNSWKAVHLIYARSRDLVTWESERLLPVMAGIPGTKNVWAPEFVYDEERGDYVLFWSSVTAPEGPQRTWYTRTRDFDSLTEPKILFDPGYTQIDATIVRADATWYLIYKDERGENERDTDNKAMRVAVSTRLDGPYEPVTGLVTPHLTEGATVFRAGDRWLMLYDHFMDRKWGAAASADLKTWAVLEGALSVPETARHGSVLMIRSDELDTLKTHFGE